MKKKAITISTLICFLFSCVLAPAVEGALDMAQQTGSQALLQAALEHPLSPYGLTIAASIGRITGSYEIPRVSESPSEARLPEVILIQDLHCHSEVQHNIAHILDEIARTAGGQTSIKVYVEGGYGTIDTWWITAIKDVRLRTQIMDALVGAGRLTGAEYWAMKQQETGNRHPMACGLIPAGRLFGLENEGMHKANIVRLGRIIDKKKLYEQKIKTLSDELDYMKAKYLTTQNKRLNKILAKYKAGAISPAQYYALMKEYVEKINAHPQRYNNLLPINWNKYPAIKTYLEVMDMQKHVRYRAASGELKEYIGTLKTKLSFAQYDQLRESTGDFSKADMVYPALARLSKTYTLGTRISYPELNELFAYYEKSQSINPLELLKEEKSLVEQLRIAFSHDMGEVEISFLADFFSCFEDYLLHKLSADDYAYFTARFEKFKDIWGKYTCKNHILDLAEDFPLLDDYYAVNEKRTHVFIDTIAASEHTDHRTVAPPPSQLIGKEIGARHEVIVVVSGGFHTSGITALLEERKISYLTITPAVTKETRSTAAIYDTIAWQQARLFASQALALSVSSADAALVSLTATRATIRIEDREIQFMIKDGKLDSVVKDKQNPVPPDTGIIVEALRQTVNFVADNYQKIIPFTNPHVVVDLIFALSRGVIESGSRRAWWDSDGLIWHIASNTEIQEKFKDRLDEIAYFPEWWQENIVSEEALNEALATEEKSHPLLAILHAALGDRLRTFVSLGTPARTRSIIEQIDEAANRIFQGFPRQRRGLVLTAGASASGKSTIAQKIARRIRSMNRDAVVVGMDHFYMKVTNLDEPSAVDWDKLVTFLDDLLTKGKAATTDGRSGKPFSLSIGPDGIVVFEGLFAFMLDATRWTGGEDAYFSEQAWHTISPFLGKESHVFIDMIPEKAKLRQLILDARKILRGRSSLEATLEKLDRVHQGANTFIYPYARKDEDIVINTYDPYELDDLIARLRVLLQTPRPDADAETVLKIKELQRSLEEASVINKREFPSLTFPRTNVVLKKVFSEQWLDHHEGLVEKIIVPVIESPVFAWLALASMVNNKLYVKFASSLTQSNAGLSSEIVTTGAAGMLFAIQAAAAVALVAGFAWFMMFPADIVLIIMVPALVSFGIFASSVLMHSFYSIVFRNDRLKALLVGHILYKGEEQRAQEIKDLAKKAYALPKGPHMMIFSGGSAGGKTTSAKEVAREIEKLGRQAEVYSLDEYYRNRDDDEADGYPRLANGKLDYDDPRALHKDLIKRHVTDLMHHIPVTVPRFIRNGMKSHRVDDKTIHLGDDGILIIEGIFALHPMMVDNYAQTPEQSQRVFKDSMRIFIDPLTPFDEFSEDDMRLIRRILRDSRHDATIAQIIDRYPSVLAGLRKYVSPARANANIVLNTYRPGELSFWKYLVLAQLNEAAEKEFKENDIATLSQLRRLIALFENVPDISSQSVRKFFGRIEHSVLREFAGTGEDMNFPDVISRSRAYGGARAWRINSYLIDVLAGHSQAWAQLRHMLVAQQLQFMIRPWQFDKERGFPGLRQKGLHWSAFVASWSGIVWGIVQLAFLLAAGHVGFGVGTLLIDSVAGIITSLAIRMVHLQSREMPVTFWISENRNDADEEILAFNKESVVVRVHRMPAPLSDEYQQLRETADLRNLAIRSNSVWIRREDGVLTVYVQADNSQSFAHGASEVVSTIQGTAGFRAIARPAVIMEDLVGQIVDSNQVVVVNCTGQELSVGDDVAVVTDQQAMSFSAHTIRAVKDAENFSRSPIIGFEVPWSDGLLDEAIAFDNRYLFFSQEQLRLAGADKIKALKKRTKIFGVYDKGSRPIAESLLDDYGLDGIICTQLSSADVESIARLFKKAVVVGSTIIDSQTAQPFVQLDLARPDFENRIKDIKPGSYVKVTLPPEDSVDRHHRIIALDSLPLSCALIFEKLNMDRGFDVSISGVNLAEFFHLSPQTPDERYEEMVAGELPMGIIEPRTEEELEDDIRLMQGQTDLPQNREFSEMVRLHLLKTADAAQRNFFLHAVIKRMKARNYLAQKGKKGDLAEPRFELLVGDILDNDAQMSGSPINMAVLNYFNDLKESVNDQPFQQELFQYIMRHKQDPAAHSTLLRLIELFAEQKVILSTPDASTISSPRMDAVRTILSAA